MKNILTRTFILLMCSFTPFTLSAQHRITGRIIDEATQTPLEIANVVLSTTDSVFVMGSTINLEGFFELADVLPGDYLLTTSYLGFTSRIILLGLSRSVDLGEIPMIEEANLLEAVTITGSTTTRKADRMVVFVTDNQKKIASNGSNILQSMKLSRLSVNPVTNEVSLPGDEVLQFCINGVRVEPSDVRALQPGEIIRVEYLDNPGLRYGDSDAVINYILKRETSGGSVSMDLGSAVTTSFGDDQLSAKFNYKKSEFGLGYSLRYRKPTETWFDREQTFHFEDGTSFTRYDEGMPGDYKEILHKLNLNYNLLDDKRFFNATLRYEHGESNNIDLANQYNSLHPENITQVSQGNDVVKNIPSLDLYYAHFLPHNQTVILNAVGTYIGSDLLSKYEETENGQPITDILSNVSGKKYSIIGEGIYEKIFKNSNRFTVGIKHTQGYTNNEYTGKVSTVTKMKQAESYIYAEYYGKINNFSYTGGLGVSRSWAEQDGKDEYTHYMFRPKVTLQYDFTPAMSLRLKGEIYNIPPSLSELSAVDQYVDTLQVVRGNPALKPATNYQLGLQYSWRKGVFDINFLADYRYVDKMIMKELHRENGLFISVFDNQRSWQKFNSELSVNVGPVNDYFQLSLTGGVNRYRSQGHNYDHKHTNFYYRVKIIGMYKKFSLVFNIYGPYDNFLGELLYRGENNHNFMLNYNQGKFTVGAGIMYLFASKYKRVSEVMNVYTPLKTDGYINDVARMALLKFSWNFSYGRKAKTIDRRLNNNDRDSGIMRPN